MLSIEAALDLLRLIDETKPLVDDTNENIAAKAPEPAPQPAEPVSSGKLWNIDSPRLRDLQEDTGIA